jgi:hypothetical protein
MTTDIDLYRPSADTPTVAPTVSRLHNPWTPHLIGACAAASAATVGVLLAALAEAVRLDVSCGVVLAAWAVVVLLSWRQGRFEKDPPASAFRPAKR